MVKNLNELKRKASPPSPLIIQELLRGGKSYMDIVHEYEIEVAQHPREKHLLWFGPGSGLMLEPLVKQCRGLILDSADNWKVIARPFDHIHEWSELDAPTIDWSKKPRFYDKVDGKLCYLYCYDGAWYVGSKHSPCAEDEIRRNRLPLNRIFWHAFHDMKYSVPPKAFEQCTFIFELTGADVSPLVHVRESNQLVLTGVRYNATGEEMEPDSFCDQGIRTYMPPYRDVADYTCIKEVLDAVVDTGLKFGEGMVITDHKWRRIIVTHPEYNSAREFRAQLSNKWLLNNIRSGHPDPALHRYASDWTGLHGIMAISFADLVKRISTARGTYDKIIDGVEFRRVIEDLPFKEVLFDLRIKKYETIMQALRTVDLDTLLSWLEVPGVDERKKEEAA